MNIASIRVKNFKAVEDSRVIKLGPLTAFVGYNGTGKSSLIEASEFFQAYAIGGLQEAVLPWFSFEHILWKGVARKRETKSPFYTRPLAIEFTGKLNSKGVAWQATLEIGEIVESTKRLPTRSAAVKREFLKVGDESREYFYRQKRRGRPRQGSQLLDLDWAPDFRQWMFLNLNPFEIGQPHRRLQSKGEELLVKTGANLAEMLYSFLDLDPSGFDAMLEALQYIIPYVANIRPEVTKDMVESRSLIKMTEAFQSGGDAQLPGWVLSSGSLRLLALLAALRHPAGPSVIFIEELENGLDPRAIGFLVDEIKAAVESGDRQIILTTHSPYLLDKLSLEHIITVERESGGPPIFRRPSEERELQKWTKQFAPGSLYSMGLFRDQKESKS